MSVVEIERKIIDPLSREEKEELFNYLAKELEKDELLQYFTPGAVYEIGTPNISPDDSAFKAASQLLGIRRESLLRRVRRDARLWELAQTCIARGKAFRGKKSTSLLHEDANKTWEHAR